MPCYHSPEALIAMARLTRGGLTLDLPGRKPVTDGATRPHLTNHAPPAVDGHPQARGRPHPPVAP